VIDDTGTKHWYNKRGQLHRLDGPAIIFTDGAESWYKNGKRHRIGGPSGSWPNGGQCWYQNDKLHRLDGPAFIDEYGTEEWWINGKEVEPIPNIICILRRKLNEKS